MVTPYIKRILKKHKEIKFKEEQSAKEKDKIKLSKMIGKVAFMYEKIRNAVDYKDEHLFRKDAIKRILKRRLVPQSSGSNISKYLINELIRARYLEDNKVPEIKISEVEDIINKYIVLRNNLVNRNNDKVTKELFDWTLGLLASEIEECLVSSEKLNSYIELFYQSVENRIKLKDDKLISKRELGLQLYIGIFRALTKSDSAMISYRLLKMYYPEWKQANENTTIKIAVEAKKIKDTIDLQMNHPIGKYILKKLKPYAVNINILENVINENQDKIEEVISDRQYLESEIKKECNVLYKDVKRKLGTSVIRSIIYIFVTKIVLAIILEMPFDLYFFGHIDYITLGINIAFPPFLLFLITMSARAPGDKNTQKIIQGINEIIYGDNNDEMIFEIKKSYKRSKFLQNLFKFLYFITFIISYGIIVLILREFNFNILSGALFLLFLSLVSYFGIRVRRISKELIVLSKKENILTFLLDLFSFPILRVGQWISQKSSKINIFVFILDFIIEAPFKSFIEIIEEWFTFVKEKKDEIY